MMNRPSTQFPAAGDGEHRVPRPGTCGRWDGSAGMIIGVKAAASRWTESFAPPFVRMYVAVVGRVSGVSAVQCPWMRQPPGCDK